MSAADAGRTSGREARATAILACYLACALLTMAVSARLWWQSPLELTAYEFDYFLGLFQGSGYRVAAERVMQGRALHAVLFTLLGALYAAILLHLSRRPDAESTARIATACALAAGIFAIGMPWVSPDVFFYIGTGWLDAHYGLNPYRYAMSQVPGFASDPMFANVYPRFLDGTTSYGPLFQKIAAALAALSGGSVKLALALHKAFYLGLHAVASGLVWRLAPQHWRKAALFGYGANPLILFSVATCAHNDHLMNVCILAAFCLLRRRQALAAGLALGTAFSLKYFPLVFLPIMLAMALLQRGEGRLRWQDLRRPAALGAGFMLAVLLLQRLYPASTEHVSHLLSTGVGVYRSSVFDLLDAMTRYVLPLFGAPEALMVREDLGGVLRLAYIAAYALLTWRYWPRLRREPFLGGIELCLIATLLYFVLVNTSNQEWYLTWIMGFAFVLPSEAARTLALRLSVAYVPLVIYTVKNEQAVMTAANLLAYLLLLACAWLYIRRQLGEATAPVIPIEAARLS